MREIYLRMAGRIIDQALDWLGDDGVIRGPVDGHDDRWQGGTAARFACPAAILAARAGRRDLAEPAARALTQVLDGVARAGARGEPVCARGQFDLTMKEWVLTVIELKPFVEPGLFERWSDILTSFPATAYDTEERKQNGLRPNNYGVAAAVGEWFRIRHELGGSREWIEQALNDQWPFFTEQGMYRDPNDPMLYDLMVRQNLNELIAFGYDGSHRDRIAARLDQADELMLDMLSPCGYAPFGGRSNALIHNEAMLIYICEREARAHAAAGNPQRAHRFREAAWRAAEAVEPFLQHRPLHFIKNRFDPLAAHGKDSGYGEYANYALLAASLFARTALLVEDDSVPVLTAPVAAPSVLHLWPAFHKTFATAGDTQVEIDTRAQPEYDATGLGRFHRAGAPPDLALSMPISAEPRYILHGAEPGKAIVHGPCWQTHGGAWQSLAEQSEAIEAVSFTALGSSGDGVAWRLVWSLAARQTLPVAEVHQTYRLTPGALHVRVEVLGGVKAVGWETPCLFDDGVDKAETAVLADAVEVKRSPWMFRVSATGVRGIALDETPRANRHARYHMARMTIAPGPFEVILSLDK